MSTKLRITVTEDILKKTIYCGIIDPNEDVSENCAIALAVRSVFPTARVTSNSIQILQCNGEGDTIICHIMDLPDEAQGFIFCFDKLSPEQRSTDLCPFEFDVDIPDEMLDVIDISVIQKLINHPTLRLISTKV